MDLPNPVKTYGKNFNTVFSCQYHIIFTPKYRRRVLINNIDIRLKELIIQKQQDFDYKIIEMEVMSDHVHLLIDIPPFESVKLVISRIKGYTSNILRSEFPELVTKLPSLWTRSFFVSTVGSVSLEIVKKYIEDQYKK